MADAFESYVELAREDIDAARQLVRDTKHSGRAAFFIEQAGEKLIKAVLSVEEIVFPTTHHQLGTLAALLPMDHEWRAELASFDSFTTFATRFRYPTPSGSLPRIPKPHEVERYIDQVAEIIDDLQDWCRDTRLKNSSRK